MAVYRVQRTRDYTVMSNYHLKDKGLTLKSKGLLSMILSLPEEWNYTTRGLASICKEGVDAIGSALKELETAGYIVRRQLRGANGRITDTEYIIYEQPQPKKLDMLPSDVVSPDTENPDSRPVRIFRQSDALCPKEVLRLRSYGFPAAKWIYSVHIRLENSFSGWFH